MGWVGAWPSQAVLVPLFVSIPERVWGGLEHYSFDTASHLNVVSIPERVWGGLERVTVQDAWVENWRFNP